MTHRPTLRKHHAFFHVLIAILGWGIYFGIAYIAFHGVIRTLGVIAAIAVITAIVITIIAHAWSRLHQWHHRTKNKRSRVPVATLHYDKDWLGYTIDSEVEAIKKAKFISIEAIEEKQGDEIIRKKQYKIEKITKPRKSTKPKEIT